MLVVYVYTDKYNEREDYMLDDDVLIELGKMKRYKTTSSFDEADAIMYDAVENKGYQQATIRGH